MAPQIKALQPLSRVIAGIVAAKTHTLQFFTF
jgi:hypothetical protein